ncbi:hypothetical protein Tco_0891199 [Tanacetum coccineum]|uniref:Reverse transcriptase domain-containing protein n=1 Tax=Tanacetum coccineum TaxID=301880 RepID=A0ABQ5C4B8_9ASTR
MGATASCKVSISSSTMEMKETVSEQLRDLQRQGFIRGDLNHFREEQPVYVLKNGDCTYDTIREYDYCLGMDRKERVKPRRVRAMAMTIQYGVRGMILAAQSEAFKQENTLAERLHGLDQQMERKEDENNSKEWSSGDDQLRLRWMIYLVVLADAIESVRDAIGFEYCLASSSGWTKSPVLWAEIRESSLTGPKLVLDTTDKVVLIKEKLKAVRDRQKSYADKRRKLLEFEVGDRVPLKVSHWKGVLCARILGIALASVVYVVRSMALCSIGVVYVVRSMALCSIGGVYVVRSMALCSIGGVLRSRRDIQDVLKQRVQTLRRGVFDGALEELENEEVRW